MKSSTDVEADAATAMTWDVALTAPTVKLDKDSELPARTFSVSALRFGSEVAELNKMLHE